MGVQPERGVAVGQQSMTEILPSPPLPARSRMYVGDRDITHTHFQAISSNFSRIYVPAVSEGDITHAYFHLEQDFT